MHSRIVVADRIANASAVVALESSVLAQGLPSPANLESADAQQAAVTKADAEPAVIGVIAGRLIVGADAEQVQALASGAVRWKVTVRDLPYVVARGLDGATTVSATSFAAEAAGIEVMATGGGGGDPFARGGRPRGRGPPWPPRGSRSGPPRARPRPGRPPCSPGPGPRSSWAGGPAAPAGA